jgi:hypothetical protein
MEHPKGAPDREMPDLPEPGTVRPSRSLLIVVGTLIVAAGLLMAVMSIRADKPNADQTLIIAKNRPETNTNLSGSATADSLTVRGDLGLGGHFNPSGSAPGIRVGAAARGGTTSVVGNDTAGTITVTVGGAPRQSGEMAVITFHTPFALTPKVQLTAVNADTATLPFFVVRSAGYFSVNSAAPVTADKTYVFDYLVTQ